MNEPERHARHFREGWEMNWSKVPDAVVYKRIPHYAPVNEPDTWLAQYGEVEGSRNVHEPVRQERARISGAALRSLLFGMEHGDGSARVHEAGHSSQRGTRGARNSSIATSSCITTVTTARTKLSPMHQEIWAHKTCDHMSVMKTGLAMIEGIYRRDGDGFGEGQDYLTNLVMFSKDKFRLDMVGMYLGGHEPGNVNLFRIAKERGLTDTFNPWEIPIYEWVNGAAMPRKLSDFARTPLKTYYLQMPGEPLFHLVNEPFDYDRIKV